jgi:glycine betaine catabolism B
MLKAIDRFLNATTMYRVVLYALCGLAGAAIIMAFLGYTSTFGGLALLASLVIVWATCHASNYVFAKIWRAPTNQESAGITGLILFFVMSPITDNAADSLFSPEAMQNAGILVLAGVLAMLSKYVLALHHKHVFNPAAFAPALLGILGSGAASWWIGTDTMLPFALIAGLLIVRKIRRFAMFFATVLASVVTVIILGLLNGMGIVESIVQHFASWPIIFFASVMVTEPLTTPPRKYQQVLYGAAIGAISSWPIVIGPVYISPDITLVAANLVSFFVGLPRRLTLQLKEKNVIARDTYEFVFASKPRFNYRAGQYLEWTLPHAHADSRGIRRYFTIASSPTEDDVRLGVKIIPSASSSFKKKLLDLKPGDKMYAAQLGGDFVLPADATRKMVFIAGGIGVTPFRSMVKHLTDTNDSRDTVLFYAVRTMQDAAYGPLFQEAEKKIGLKTVYVVNEQPPESKEPKFIDAPLLTKHVPDFKDRTYYLSGPVPMVDAYKKLLKGMGVPARSIVTDYFPGFA